MRNLFLSIARFLKFWYNTCLDLCYPRDCYFCRQSVGEEGHICQECLERLSLHRNPACIRCGAESTLRDGPDFICSDCLRHPPAIERTFIVARYENALRDLIHTFKYRKGLWLTEDLGRYLFATYLERILGAGIHIDALIPIPIQPAKHRHRGYNQTQLLANYLARQTHLPILKHVLKRVNTGITSQTRLHRSERLQNAKRAYHLTASTSLAGKHILLIDDVVTTGATCNTCAELLRSAGATKVYVLALARPLHP